MLGYVASQAGLVLRNVRLVDDLRSSRRAAGHHAGRRTPPTRAQPARRRPAEPGVSGAAAADGRRVRRSGALSAGADRGIHAAAAGDRRAARAGPGHPPGDPDRPRARPCADLARRALPGARPPRQPGAPAAAAPVEGTLYFVAAEALTNVARYSQAPEVFVVVTDDGRHGDAARWSTTASAAPTCPRARACSVWPTGSPSWTARFVVDSPPGEGTTISCRVPVPAAASPEQAGPRARSRSRCHDRWSDPDVHDRRRPRLHLLHADLRRRGRRAAGCRVCRHHPGGGGGRVRHAARAAR